MSLMMASPSPRVDELVSVSWTEIVVFDEMDVEVPFLVSSLASKMAEAV
jgi:hypothetical protein